jgi:hypothetical protein
MLSPAAYATGFWRVENSLTGRVDALAADLLVALRLADELGEDHVVYPPLFLPSTTARLCGAEHPHGTTPRFPSGAL